MGNCVSGSMALSNRIERKPASVLGSADHLGSGNEDNVTVSSFGNLSLSMNNNATSVNTCNQNSGNNETFPEDSRVEERRGSATPSLARSEEADGAVVMGYSEPHSFRILRRQNNQSSFEALSKAMMNDPSLKQANITTETAPSRRPTVLGPQNMQ